MQVPMQPFVVEYRVAKGNSLDALVEEVNAALKQGFTTHGPLSGNSDGWYQPLVMLELRPLRIGKIDRPAILPVPGILK